MPQYIFTSLLLISQLTTYGHASRSATYTITDNDLRNHCDLQLDGYSYNLCPLMDRTMLVEGTGAVNEDEDRGEGSSSGSRFYEVALGGLGSSSQTQIPSTAGISECDADTWVCMLETYTEQDVIEDGTGKSVRRLARAIPIARNLKRSRKNCSLKATASINLEVDELENRPPPLHLLLHGGRSRNGAQSATISFSCSERESLEFSGEKAGIHSFAWATPHGCPRRLPRPRISVAEDPDSGSEAPPAEKKEGDDDLLPPNKSRSRRWIAIFVVVLIIGLVGGTILSNSARARDFVNTNFPGITYTVVPLLAQATTKLRPLGTSLNSLTAKSIDRLGSRFRQGDSQLVRWAQEDMTLTDSDDFMVNGYDTHDDGWNADGLDEYIPLTISGRGSKMRSYGATPDVETFEERSGLGKYFHK